MAERIVLCVDDEPVILLAMRQKLRVDLGAGYRCETSASAESALELVGELRAAGHELVAVVSDWLMPGMRGDEFLRQVRKLSPASRLVLLTGYAEREMIAALEAEIGLDAVFHKPCDMKALAAIIAGEPRPGAEAACR
jgi:CheY-like chemotaxis protein